MHPIGLLTNFQISYHQTTIKKKPGATSHSPVIDHNPIDNAFLPCRPVDEDRKENDNVLNLSQGEVIASWSGGVKKERILQH
jgi:hypothetical protein